MLKLQVKQKARELIEKQIKDQKLLLKKFEEAKSVEEKSQILNVNNFLILITCINSFKSYQVAFFFFLNL